MFPISSPNRFGSLKSFADKDQNAGCNRVNTHVREKYQRNLFMAFVSL
jgi:hypothetical protein